MIEKKTSLRLLAAILLLFFSFSNPCHARDKELLNRNFLSVPENKHADFIGEVHFNRPQERISEYRCMPASEVEASCKIISKESGYYYCLAIDGKEYRISDMIDYGEPDLKVYTNNNSRLLLVGLIDLYESVYFVYYFKDGVLARLGQIDIEQPGNVKEEGAKKVSFKVEEENKKMIVKSYLDGAYAYTSEFLLKSIPGTENK